MFIYFTVQPFFISRRVDAGAELRGPDQDRAGVDVVEADDLEERDGDQTVSQVRSHSTIFTIEQSCKNLIWAISRCSVRLQLINFTMVNDKRKQERKRENALLYYTLLEKA